MGDRIGVFRPEPPVVTFHLLGLVAADADSDWEGRPSTLRIDGVDLVDTLASHLEGLGGPVAARFEFAGEVVETDAVTVETGHVAAAYWDETQDAAIRLGEWPALDDEDLLERMSPLHAQTVDFTCTLTGYVPPLVTARLAHHWTDRATGEHFTPGDEVTRPLPLMRQLARATLVREHADQVRKITR